MSELEDAAAVVLSAAREASQLVMSVYATRFDVQYKIADDPVTRADHEANALLCDRLKGAFSGIPIVAEESDPSSYAGFEKADAAWFVDPLDGTREFVAHSGEFAVMIGLAQRGRAKMGVIVAPVWGRTFLGIVGEGAWEIDSDASRRPIHVSSQSSLSASSILVSRSRTPPQLASLVASIGAGRAVIHGSSGLKAVLVALGMHDVYLQRGSAGMRWDACASEALVVAAGGACTEVDGAPFEYGSGELLNARGLLATNGLLHPPLIEALRNRP